MATDRLQGWVPDWAVPPGEILQEALEERHMSQAELGRRMNRPLKTINEIVKGKAAITYETAIQLERALGISTRFWNNLERDYREHQARQEAGRELAASASWADKFPIKGLVKHQLLEAGHSKAEIVEGLLAFFRVSSPVAWERVWLSPEASYRASAAFASKPEAVASWLRWGQIEAEKLDLPTYSASSFREALGTIRAWTAKEPFSALRLTQGACKEAGVALVLLPELPGTRLSGAVHWTRSERPVIQISLRYGTDDQVWFTFFHESDHLLEGPRRRVFVDAERDSTEDLPDEEAAADHFARNFLIAPGAYEEFVTAEDFSSTAIKRLAHQLSIAPGIVVGRLQRDGHLRPAELNNIKKPVKWHPHPS
jgi:addiction module HigA family antidote